MNFTLLRHYLLLYGVFMALILTQCGGAGTQTCRKVPNVKSIEPKIKVKRLETFITSKDATIRLQVLKDNPAFAALFIGYGTDALTDQAILSELERLSQSPFIDTLNQEVAMAWPDTKLLEEQLTEGYSRIKSNYPNFKVPKVYSVISGFSVDMKINEDVVILGLDAFKGESGKYRLPPNLLPMYIQKRMTPRHLASSVMLATSGDFVDIDETDNTMLATMIQWGKTYYFVDQMLPCVADSLIIGYSPKDMKGVAENLDKIYGYFVKRNLFYNTDLAEITRFTGERPQTPEIAEGCPGRVGRYIGWMIVRRYMETHPDITLPQLMAETDAKKIFTQSKYKP